MAKIIRSVIVIAVVLTVVGLIVYRVRSGDEEII